MSTSRRTFLPVPVSPAGWDTLPLSGLGATITTAAAEPHFGPKIGQALLSRNENPYGPAPSALRAISETAKMGCYYADRGLQRLTAMIAERHNVMPSQVVVGAGSTEILCAISARLRARGAILCPDLFWDTTVVNGERRGVSSIRVPLAARCECRFAPPWQAARETAWRWCSSATPTIPPECLIPSDALRSYCRKGKPAPRPCWWTKPITN